MVNPLSTTSSTAVADPALVSTPAVSTSEESSSVSSFAAILNGYLQPDENNQVNEEQLFAAVIGERVADLKGSDVEEKYREFLQSEKTFHANGAPPEEETARSALKALAEAGFLTMEEAEQIHAEAFQAAQLDDNTDALYDGIGSSYDNTIAVMLVESAIESAQNRIDSFEAGEDAGRLSLDIESDLPTTSTSTAEGTTSYPPGFVFKPVAERDGHLAVLLPSSMAGSAQEINIVDESGQVIEHGDSYGIYEDGRPLFRFSRPGSGYPDGMGLEIVMGDGQVEKYVIPDPSRRYG